MDKVAKGPDYNTHKQTNKQKITRYVRVELPAKRQITTTSNLQRTKKKLKQKFKAEKRNGNNLLYL